jgi:hypothetical protein
MNLTEAASFLAQQWPVFPCNAEKRPVTAHGLKDATTDAALLREMFRKPGAAMIGVPTGIESGFFVVDLDLKEGASGLEWLAAQEHRLPRTRRHRTRSGGLHLLFLMPPNRNIRNSASKIAPGVDVRGNGGYIIAPPSPGYAIADDAMPAEAPAWLLDLVDPPVAPPAPRPAPTPRRHEDGNGTRYGMSALSDECDAILAASFGQQESTLNSAALKIGALVAGGELSHGYAREALVSAGMSMPSQGGRPAWSSIEIRNKVERGMADGSRSPRNAPPREVRHTVRVEIVPPEPPPYDEPPEWVYGEPDMALDAGERPEPARDAPKQPRAPLPLITFADAAAGLDCQDFVEGVLTEGAMSVLYGESNSGKTFFAADMAFHVAAGRMWRDREVEQGAVIIVAMEGRHGIMNRLAAIKQHFGMEDANIPLAVIPCALNMLDSEVEITALIDAIKHVAAMFDIPVKLVIIDTLARAMAGGNENSPEDMGALVKSGNAVQEATNAHCMWIHHSGKDQAKGARGHSSLRAATDTEIEVTNIDGQRTARVSKQRDLPSGDSFAFTLKVVELGLNRRGKAVTSCIVLTEDEQAPGGASARPRLTGHKQRALEVLADLIATSGQTGHPGVPPGISSVPDKWWRERFYERAAPGESPDSKQKAFKRASSDLLNDHHVGMDRGRVWCI